MKDKITRKDRYCARKTTDTPLSDQNGGADQIDFTANSGTEID